MSRRRNVVVVLRTLLLASAGGVRADAYSRLEHGPVFRSVRDFGAIGDGVEDDTASLQAAINYGRGIQGQKRPAVVFVPPGTYRVTDTLVLWQGTHLIGDQDRPPTILLPAETPGFASSIKSKPLITTAPGVNQPPGALEWDAPAERQGSDNNNFRNTIRYIKVRMEQGNPGAIGIRWQPAQNSALRNVEIRSVDAAVGLYTDGLSWDVTVIGGKVGAYWNYPGGPVASWHLSGQTEAAVVLQHWWTCAFVNLQIENAARGIVVQSGYGVTVLNSSFRNVGSGCAIEGPVVESGAAEVHLEDVRTERVDQVVKGRLPAASRKASTVAAWSSGKAWVDGKEVAGPVTPLVTSRPPWPVREYPKMSNPVSVTKYGAQGDGRTDDTAALRKALAENQEVFLPHGTYLVSDTLRLRSDTLLMGESFFTQILLKAKSPGFGDPARPKAVLATPPDPQGTTSVAGVSVSSEGGNPGAILLEWRVGAKSSAWGVPLGSYAAEGALYCVEISGAGGGVFYNVAGIGGGGVAGTHVHATSRGPLWCYYFDYEHATDFPYLFEGASNYYIIGIGYEQPQPQYDSPTAVTLRDCSNINFDEFWMVGYRSNAPIHAVEIVNSQDIRMWHYLSFCIRVHARIERDGQEPQIVYAAPPDRWRENTMNWLPGLILTK